MSYVKPTRSELIELKKRIALAKNGHKLLKKKRDGLILEFFQILKDVKKERAEVADIYRKAAHRMNVARMLESDIKIKSIALATSEKASVAVSKKNIMGVS
ncbi:V-type ATP synthase subunit D, partial [Candidatus Magnetobacterium casense]